MDTLTDTARLTLIVVAVWVGVVWLCGAVYVAVTYAASARELPPRPLGRTLHAILREMWLLAWTQPLLPWFQVFGKRLGSGGGTVPVVLVHGYFQNRVDFLYLMLRLRSAGCGPLYACNFFWPQRLERSSGWIRRFVERVCSRTGAEQVDMLTHSSGGLFALDIVAERPELLRRAVMIALPGKGVPWRGPVLGSSGSQLRAGSAYQVTRQSDARDVRALSIYSSHDNLVYPVTTSMIQGCAASNLEVDDVGHLSMLFDRRVGDAVCEFLLGD